MSHTAVANPPGTSHVAVPTLVNGDRLSQEEFHRRYEAMPEDFKAELIGGIVYVASPPTHQHGTALSTLTIALGNYVEATPGVEVSCDVTTVLGKWGEPQPDVLLRILPEFGGRSKVEAGYLVGAPELVAEVAHSSVAIDLHAKKRDYEAAGVLEYVVVCLREKVVRRFVLEGGRYEEVLPDAGGVVRSRAFPGLCLDSLALLTGNLSQALAASKAGLKSEEYRAFVKGLAARREG